MNTCDLCQRDIHDDQGGWCDQCISADVNEPRDREWWA